MTPITVADARGHLEAGRFADAHACLGPLFGDQVLGRLRCGDLAALDVAYQAARENGNPAIDAVVFAAARRAGRDVTWMRRIGAACMHRRGELAFSSWLDRLGAPRDDAERAMVALMRAEEALAFRDTALVERSLVSAVAHGARDASVVSLRARAAEVADDLDAAFAHAAELVQLAPQRCHAYLALAHVHATRGAIEEAIETVARASRALDSGVLLLACAQYELDLARFDAAEQTLLRAAEAYTRAKHEAGVLLVARTRAHAALRQGDAPRARASLAAAPRPQAKDRAYELLETAASREGKRVELAVPPVRQDFLTCGPATLTSIVRYFGDEVGHDDVVAEIWNAGSRSDREADFVRKRGFVARPFRVTFAAAQALLDAGIPFTIATWYPNGAHLQAAIGYDTRLESLLLREPSSFAVVEVTAETLLECNAASGPLGMAIAPISLEATLSAIELPDSDAMACRVEVSRCTSAHDQKGAREAALRMQNLAEDERTRAFAAWYAASLVRRDVHVEAKALAALCPKDAWARHLELTSSTGYVPSDDQLCALLAASTMEGGSSFASQALELCLTGVGTGAHETRAVVATYLHTRGVQHVALDALARWARRRGAMRRAYRFARFAVTASPEREHATAMLLELARADDCRDDAIELLTARAEKHAYAFTWAVRPLCRALIDAGRFEEVRAIIERAFAAGSPELRADLAFLANDIGDTKYAARCIETLPSAHTASHRAIVARHAGEHERALEALGEALREAPLDAWARAAELDLLCRTRGIAAALGRIEACMAEEGADEHLAVAHLDLLTRVDPSRKLEAIRTFVGKRPHDAWALRELAIAAKDLGHTEEANDAIARAKVEAPRSVYTALTGNRVLGGSPAECHARLRAAVLLDEEAESWVFPLLADAADAEREETARSVTNRLALRTPSGEMLRAIVTAAVELPDEERVALARAFGHPVHGHAEASGLLVETLVKRGDTKGAVEAARARTAARSHEAAAWLDLELALSASGDRAGAIAAAERAVATAPVSALGHRVLLGLLSSPGDEARYAAAADTAVRLCPGDTDLRLMLARRASDAGDHGRAIEHMRHACAVAPLALAVRDAYALMLSTAKRFDEALAVCDETPPLERLRVPMLGRRACVQNARGEIEAAITAMTEIVEASPTYAFGHLTLVQWHLARGDSDALGRDAARIERSDSAGLQERVAAFRARYGTGDVEGCVRNAKAMIALRGRVELSTLRTFVAQLASIGQATCAAELLATQRPHHPAERLAVLDAEIALALKDVQTLVRVFRALVVAEDEGVVRRIGRGAVHAGLHGALFDAIAEAVQEAGAPAYLGLIYAALAENRGKPIDARALVDRTVLTDALVCAVATRVATLPASVKGRVLPVLRARGRDSVTAFEDVLAVLMDDEDHESAQFFAAGYEALASLDERALDEVAELALLRGDFEGGLRARHHGLERRGRDADRTSHAAFVALEHLAEGRLVEARELASRTCTHPFGAKLAIAVRDVIVAIDADEMELASHAAVARASVQQLVTLARKRYGWRIAARIFSMLARPLASSVRRWSFVTWAYPVRVAAAYMVLAGAAYGALDMPLFASALVLSAAIRGGLAVSVFHTPEPLVGMR